MKQDSNQIQVSTQLGQTSWRLEIDNADQTDIAALADICAKTIRRGGPDSLVKEFFELDKAENFKHNPLHITVFPKINGKFKDPIIVAGALDAMHLVVLHIGLGLFTGQDSSLIPSDINARSVIDENNKIWTAEAAWHGNK